MQWHNTKEELPPIDEDVFVLVAHQDNNLAYYVMYYDGKDYFRFTINGMFLHKDHCLAWAYTDDIETVLNELGISDFEF